MTSPAESFFEASSIFRQSRHRGAVSRGIVSYKASQVSLFPSRSTADSPAQSRYEPVDNEEASLLGRALLSQLRGDPLTPEQQTAIERAGVPSRRAPEPVVERSETLLSLPRGDAELRVSWRSYRGSTPFLDLRRWEKGRSGGMHPTKQGVVVRLRELPQLFGVIRAVARRAGSGETE